MKLFSARYFDGQKIQPVTALVEVSLEGLKISIEENHVKQIIEWPKEELQLLERPYQDKPAVFGCKLMLGARLVVEELDAYESILPLVHSRNIKLSHVHHPWRSAWILVAAIVIIMVLPVWKISTVSLWIANLVPYSWEEEIWEKNVKPRFNGQVECVDPEGRKALDYLIEKLSRQTGSKHKFDIRVIDSPDFVNAESTPGFHIFIYSGLLNINDPDGIAGVIAHEMGHSLKHHVIAIFINQMGVRAFYKAMLGLSENNVAFDFINLKYSRDYEWQADDIGLDLIKKAKISPEGFRHSMEFLAKDTGDFEGLEAYLVDHPTHHDRIENIRANEDLLNPEPSLTQEQWKALKNICSKKEPLKLD